MRLILEYESGDGYTFSCTNTHPIIYGSPEKFLVDLMNAALSAIEEKKNGEFSLAGQTLDCNDFYKYIPSEDVKIYRDKVHLQKVNDDFYMPLNPSVLTVDEWFQTVEKLNNSINEERNCKKETHGLV